MPAPLSAGTMSSSALRLRTRSALLPDLETEALRTMSTISCDSESRSGTWCHCTAGSARAAWCDVAAEYGTAPEAGSAARGRMVGKDWLYQSTSPACERKLVVSVRR